MFKRLYIVLLFILHSVVDILEFLCDTWVYLKQKIYINNQANDFCDITRRKGLLSHLPRHITVLLGTENPSYNDLTNIVLWSIAAGIPFLSFYDCNGLLKKSEILFQREVENRKNIEDHVIWHNLYSNNYKNGYVGKKIHVKILSSLDGRIQFANVCRKLSETDTNIQNINLKFIDNMLREFYEFPDPDLALYCGKTLSLYDYPPWQISVTEFLHIRSHNIFAKDFIDVLIRYNKCEQRLGK